MNTSCRQKICAPSTFLDQVADAGIDVLKIEGRGRAPEYVKTTIECYREALDALENGSYNAEKVSDWMQRLDTVYNRGFWSGYYLGQQLGEWHDASGSKATQKKVYIAKGMHYYPKTQIAEFEVEAQKIKQGDRILITGPTTGVVEEELTELYVNGHLAQEAKKGDRITFKSAQRIRTSDKLYKLVENN
jgi:U32 family peptidase